MITIETRHHLINKNPPIGRITHVLQGTHQKFSDTKRVERVFKLLLYLNEFRTYKEIASHLDISERSARRYIHLLLHLGFTVERSMEKYLRFRAVNLDEYFRA